MRSFLIIATIFSLLNFTSVAKERMPEKKYFHQTDTTDVDIVKEDATIEEIIKTIEANALAG